MKQSKLHTCTWASAVIWVAEFTIYRADLEDIYNIQHPYVTVVIITHALNYTDRRCLLMQSTFDNTSTTGGHTHTALTHAQRYSGNNDTLPGPWTMNSSATASAKMSTNQSAVPTATSCSSVTRRQLDGPRRLWAAKLSNTAVMRGLQTPPWTDAHLNRTEVYYSLPAKRPNSSIP